MKHDWQADEPAEQWTLLPGERELLANKTGATRLGFVVPCLAVANGLLPMG